MTGQTDTNWITEGATVCEYRPRFHDTDWIKKATIAKLTKTQIVLDNGERFNRQTLMRLGEEGGGWHAGRTELKAVDDPAVVAVRAARVWSNLVHNITETERKRDSKRLSHGRVLELLDELEQSVAAARASVEALGVPDAARVAEGK